MVPHSTAERECWNVYPSEEDEEYIMPVNVVSVPKLEETE